MATRWVVLRIVAIALGVRAEGELRLVDGGISTPSPAPQLSSPDKPRAPRESYVGQKVSALL